MNMFQASGVRNPEYWQCIRYIVPAGDKEKKWFSFQSYTKKRLASVDTSAELQIMKEAKLSFLVGQEVETYLMDIDDHKKSDFNSLEWWHMSHKRYPNVAHAARKWLSVSGTSTPSE